MSTCNTPFKLKELNMVGGDYKEILVHIADQDNNGTIMSIDDLQLNFSLIEYKNRSGTPLLEKNCSASANDDTGFLVVLNPDDTKNLADKFIYQLSVKAPNNKQETFQGIITIDKNINPDAFAE